MPMAVVGGLLPMPMTMLAMDESMAKDVVFVCRSRPDAWTVMASLQKNGRYSRCLAVWISIESTVPRTCVCVYFTNLHLVNFLTINQQFGHEAEGNRSGKNVCEWTSFLKELMMRVLKAWAIPTPSCWIVDMEGVGA
jgi:hypothetical protein